LQWVVVLVNLITVIMLKDIIHTCITLVYSDYNDNEEKNNQKFVLKYSTSLN